LPPSCADFLEINLLENTEPAQACFNLSALIVVVVVVVVVVAAAAAAAAAAAVVEQQ
jgi:hypothetical protein